MARGGFFIFIFFIFVFYKNIFLIWKFIGIYPGRPAAGPQGLFCKKFHEKFAPGPLEDRSPGIGAAGPPGRPAAGQLDLAGRLRGDRLPLHYIRVWLPPQPSLASLKIQKKKEKKGGRERKGEGERRSGEALLDFQAGDCRQPKFSTLYK